MTEEVIAGLLEKSLVGGAFIYMLHFFLGKFASTLDNVSSTLDDVSTTLVNMNSRMEKVEQRLEKLEGGDK
jgi:hypothetical protein